MLPSDLLKMLVCPRCNSELKYHKSLNILICEHCGAYYTVRGGIPDLRPEAARKIEELNKSEKNSNR